MKVADNYTLFSAGIDRITPEERAWIELHLNPKNWADGTPPTWIVGDEDEDLGFDWSLDETPPDRVLGEGESFLWLYADETGTPEEVALFVQGFLRRFRPD